MKEFLNWSKLARFIYRTPPVSGFALGPKVAIVKSAMFVSRSVPGLCWAIVLSVWWWFTLRYTRTSSRTG